MKNLLRITTIFIFLFTITISTNAKDRVICQVETISDNEIEIKLVWSSDATKSNIRITGWNLVSEDILKVGYIHGDDVIEGWDTRKIVNSKYKFPMKIILEDQTKEVGSFTDLPSNKEEKYSILNLYHRGIISGYPDGEFKPNNLVTRAEFAAMVVKTANYNLIPWDNISFKDVSKTFWGRDYIMTLTNKEILSGRGNGIFDPNGYVTIGEAIAIIDRTFMFYNKDGKYGYNLKYHWSNENFKKLVNSNIVKNHDSYYYPYTPNIKATRKDCAILLSRVIEQINETK